MQTAGVLNVDKPAGTTSFGVVRRLRGLTGARRVGHAGTLDPLATGVLPILFGSATRLADYALLLPKTYAAEIHFGYETATDDGESERTAIGDPSALTAAEVESALGSFVGRFEQRPPAYSAVKVLGERAYERARRGQPSRPEPRWVQVHSARLLRFQAGEEATASVEIVCGSGTYLRSIARDLGQKLGVGGYLGRLVRTRYGLLQIESAVALNTLESVDAVEARLLPPETILPDMECVRLTLEQTALVRQGRPVRVLPEPRDGAIRAHDEAGNLVALGKLDPLRRTFVPEKVLG